MPRFSLDVYSRPVGERELTRVRALYEQFYNCFYLVDWAGPKLEDRRSGANVVARLLVEKPVRIQVVSYAPYATPNVFKQVVKEAVEEHCAKLPGKKSRLVNRLFGNGSSICSQPCVALVTGKR